MKNPNFMRILMSLAFVLFLLGLGLVTPVATRSAAVAHASDNVNVIHTTGVNLIHDLQKLRPDLPVGWCSSENCDNQWQDGGSANCSTFQYIITTQTVRSRSGTAFATAYTFESQDTNKGTPCYAAWNAIAFDSGYVQGWLNTDAWIGTLNTKIYEGYEETQGSTEWFSTSMLSDVDESGTCVSAWQQGSVLGPNYFADTYNVKIIAGGPHC